MNIKQRLEKIEQSLDPKDIARILTARHYYRDEIKAGRTFTDIRDILIEDFEIPPESLPLITGKLSGRMRELDDERIRKHDEMMQSPEALKNFALWFVDHHIKNNTMSRQEAIEMILRKTPCPPEVFN